MPQESKNQTEYESDKKRDSVEFDVVIVGGGPAGLSCG